MGEFGTENSPGKVVAPYYVRGLSLGVPAYLIGVHLWTWVFMLPTFLGGRADFRQLYTAGFMVRSGYASQLYDYDSQHRFQNALVSSANIALHSIISRMRRCSSLRFLCCPFALHISLSWARIWHSSPSAIDC